MGSGLPENDSRSGVFNLRLSKPIGLLPFLFVSVRDKHGVGTGAGYRGGIHMGLGDEPKCEAGWMHRRGNVLLIAIGSGRDDRRAGGPSPSWRGARQCLACRPACCAGLFPRAVRRASRSPGRRSESRTPHERSDAGSRRRQNILGDRRRQQGDWLATDAWRASMRARTRRSRLASETRCCSAIRS